jgi:predicted alpha/beta hydrolase
MATKPAIVLVPGSFVAASIYDTFVPKLTAAGYNVQAVDLATVTDDITKSSTTMYDDVAVISAVVEKLADEGHDVLLLPHSYGGIPATQSVKGLAKDQRATAGKKGGVIGILYVTSVVATIGNSATSKVPMELLDAMQKEV